MDLHRSDKKPEWEKLRSRNRNFWQRIAAATGGLITPGNAASLTGLALVLLGIWEVYQGFVLQGVALIASGRLLDLVDGTVAHKTGTKSPLGEAVDASIDKVEIIAILPVLALTGIMAPWQIIFIAAINAVNALSAGVARLRRIRIQSSRAGKYATALQWIVIILYALAFALQDADSSYSAAINLTVNAAFFFMVVVSIFASSMYVFRASVTAAGVEAE